MEAKGYAGHGVRSPRRLHCGFCARSQVQVQNDFIHFLRNVTFWIKAACHAPLHQALTDNYFIAMLIDENISMQLF